MKPLHKLKQLSVSKVSLVPKGSNPEADVVFYKQDVSRATFNEIMQGEVLRATLYKIYNACYTMQDAISSAFNSNGDSAAEVRESIGQFKAYVENLLDEIKAGKVTKESTDFKAITETLVERHNKWAAQFTQEKKMKKAIKDMSADELRAHAEELERQIVEKTDPTTPPAPAAPAIPEEVARQLPEEVQTVIRAQAASISALTAANEANSQVIRQLQEESELRRFEEIARAEIPNVKGTIQEKAKMLRQFHKISQEFYDQQLAVLKSADEALRTHALREIGSNQPGAPAADTAAGQLDALARTIREKNPDLSHAQAYERACQQRTDLYAEMRNERFAGHRA
jgi:hypothetical protein